MTTRPDRIPCAVLGCRRTAPRQEGDGPTIRICCGKCWRLGRSQDRAAHRAALRAVRPFLDLSDAAFEALPLPKRIEVVAAFDAAHRSFDAVVATATEARAGVG